MFKVSGLVKKLHKVLGELVVGFGPRARLFYCFFYHSVNIND